MFDGLVLQGVLGAIVIIAAAVAVIWFVCGITRKSAVWIVACVVPAAVGIALVLCFVIA